MDSRANANVFAVETDRSEGLRRLEAGRRPSGMATGSDGSDRLRCLGLSSFGQRRPKARGNVAHDECIGEQNAFRRFGRHSLAQ